MPSRFNFTQDGYVYSFDDVFIPKEDFSFSNLWVWGNNTSDGRLGDNSTTSKSTPVTTSTGGTTWKQVSVGERHTASIKSDGTLWVWGFRDRGILGNGENTTSIGKSTPITTFAGGTNWSQVSAGWQNTAAIKTDGTLWIWGVGGYGNLGNGLTGGTGGSPGGPYFIPFSRSTPLTTFAGGTTWSQVSCGRDTNAAIKTNGTLWTWGPGTNGKLGNNSTTDRSTPITTFAGGTTWRQVSCGGDFVAAIKTNGTLWVWGGNAAARLGINNSDANRLTPVTTFAGGTTWRDVSCGDQHVAATKTDGTLWTWGNGLDGRLGNASVTNRSTPVTTFAGGTNWKEVSAHFLHTTAIKTDGTLWGWGRGNDGQIGSGTLSIGNSTPIEVYPGLSNWTSIQSHGSGGTHSAAISFTSQQ